MNTQIQQRLNLLEYYTTLSAKTADPKVLDRCLTISSITIKQITTLLEKELTLFYTYNNASKKDLNCNEINFENNKLLVIDLICIPSEYKDKSIEDIEEMYSKKYGCKVLLVDTSRQNTQTGSVNNSAYFI